MPGKTPDRAPRDVVSQEESTGGQKESKLKVRKRGHGPRDWDNLRIVLDLLLDLAVEGATEGWDKVQTNQPKDYANLRRALVVRWDLDEDDNLNLLVTSTKRDPDAKSSKTKPVEQSSTITLEAVRQVLDATGRRLNLKGRGANTPEAEFTVDRIRNALDNLKDLQIRRSTVESFYDGFWSFWILFPSDCAGRKQDCIAYVESMWEKKWSGAIDAEAGDDPDRDPLQLARTKERLDKLDRWIQANLNGWRKTFFSSYEKHQLIYVPLRLETPQPETPPENKQCEEPATYLSNLIKTELSINNKRLILIEGEAGSGKTSLLVAAARLLMDQNLWPILLVPPKDKSHDIVKAVRRPLANVDPKISDSVVEELLRAGKLVLFIDQYSELNEDEQEWYNRELDGLNHTVIVISSRSQLQKGYFSYWEELKIKTTRLQSNEYTSFFSVWFEKLRDLWLPGSSFQKPATSTNAYPHIITTTLKQIAPDESTVLFALLAVRFYFDYHADDDCKIVSAQLAKLGLGSSRIISWHNLAFEYANKCLYSHSPDRAPGLREPTFKMLQNLAFEAFSHKDNYFSQSFSQDLLDQYFAKSSTQINLHESNLIQSSLIQKEFGQFKFTFSSLSNLLASLALIRKYKSDSDKDNLDAPDRVKEFAENLINKSANGGLRISFMQALRLACLDESIENPTWLEVANTIKTYLERNQSLQEPDPTNTRNNLERHRKHRTFIGRTAELEDLKNRLSNLEQYPDRRIIIKGIGGAGKTTLAIEAASSLIEPSKGVYTAIYFATAAQPSMNASNTPEPEKTFNNLKDLIAGLLAFCKDELNMSGCEDNKIKLKEYLESRDTRTLIILDNFEDIRVDEADEISKYFDNILGSRYKLLITTRDSNSIHAQIDLRGLRHDDSIKLIDELLSRHSSELKNNINLDQNQKDKIIRAADSIPLAIDYIIKWLMMGESLVDVIRKVKSAKGEVCRRLHDNIFEKIKTENPECLRLLYALTFAHDSFDEEMLIDIANASAQIAQMQDNLNMLHRFSWVISSNSQLTGFKRYSFICSLTRGYLQQALSKDDAHKSLRESWIECYVKKAEEYGNDDYGNWHEKFDRINEDWSNFKAVFDWCRKNWRKTDKSKHEYHYVHAKNLWRSLQRFFYLYPNFETRGEWSEYLQHEAEVRGDQEIKPEIYISVAWLRLMKDCNTDIEEAVKSLKTALGCSHVSALSQIEANINLGVCMTRLGNFSEADNYFTVANNFCVTLKQNSDMNLAINVDERRIKRAQLRILLYSGERFYREKNFGKAQELYEEVDKGAKEIDWLRFRIKANERLAFLDIQYNKLTDAQCRLEEWISFAKTNRDDRRIAFFYRDFAELYFRQERFREAEDYALSAEAAFRRLAMNGRSQEMKGLRQRIVDRKNQRHVNLI